MCVLYKPDGTNEYESDTRWFHILSMQKQMLVLRDQKDTRIIFKNQYKSIRNILGYKI